MWFDEPPASALQLDDLTGVAVFNAVEALVDDRVPLGLRGRDAALIQALKQFRPTIGTAPQEFVQRASVVAWSDEEHVERARASYRAKRDVLVSTLSRHGLRLAGGPASMYLWVATPDGASSEDFAARLLDRGVLVAPGYLGASGEGYVRFALVPTLECERAAEILEDAL